MAAHSLRPWRSHRPAAVAARQRTQRSTVSPTRRPGGLRPTRPRQPGDPPSVSRYTLDFMHTVSSKRICPLCAARLQQPAVPHGRTVEWQGKGGHGTAYTRQRPSPLPRQWQVWHRVQTGLRSAWQFLPSSHNSSGSAGALICPRTTPCAPFHPRRAWHSPTAKIALATPSPVLYCIHSKLNELAAPLPAIVIIYHETLHDLFPRPHPLRSPPLLGTKSRHDCVGSAFYSPAHWPAHFPPCPPTKH